jgi:riboflavin synthase
MFTGLVEEVGEVVNLRKDSHGYRLDVHAPRISGQVRIGDSVAVNGVCLTVVADHNRTLHFNILEETLRLTNLGRFRPGKKVNLERALTLSQPLGGHFVQGHVDCTTELLSYDEVGADHRLVIALPPQFRQYVVYKGSICINGVSLTVAEVNPSSLTMWIVRHTHENTSFASLRIGTRVNLEFDMLAKYVERIMIVRGENQGDPLSGKIADAVAPARPLPLKRDDLVLEVVDDSLPR